MFTCNVWSNPAPGLQHTRVLDVSGPQATSIDLDLKQYYIYILLYILFSWDPHPN